MSTKIRSKQAIYTDAAMKRALPENHPDAAFLVVGHGCEIHENELEKYDGADKLANSAPKPIETVKDHQFVNGKTVAGEKVKLETDPAKPNENPANDGDTSATAQPAANKSSAKKSAAK